MRGRKLITTKLPITKNANSLVCGPTFSHIILHSCSSPIFAFERVVSTLVTGNRHNSLKFNVRVSVHR